MTEPQTMTGGRLLVNCLIAQGCDRIFTVPGESFLAVLDALHYGAEALPPAEWRHAMRTLREHAQGMATGPPAEPGPRPIGAGSTWRCGTLRSCALSVSGHA